MKDENLQEPADNNQKACFDELAQSMNDCMMQFVEIVKYNQS